MLLNVVLSEEILGILCLSSGRLGSGVQHAGHEGGRCGLDGQPRHGFRNLFTFSFSSVSCMYSARISKNYLCGKITLS